MLTLNELIKNDRDFYNTNGFKGSFQMDESILANCLTEKSFVEAYNAATISNVEKLTLKQLIQLFQIKHLEIKLSMYFTLSHYAHGNKGNCVDIESVLNLN
jgi:hypothetical protein